jgi:hypothetical protein
LVLEVVWTGLLGLELELGPGEVEQERIPVFFRVPSDQIWAIPVSYTP